MKIILIINTLLLFLVCCNNSNTSEFDKYKTETSFPDSINLTQVDIFSLPSFDTLINAKKSVFTIDTTFKYHVKNYKSADCRVVKYITGIDSDILVIFYSRSIAGDGDPIVQISTINKQGEIIDKFKINMIYSHDYGLEPTQWLIFNSASSFDIYTRKIIKELEDDSLKLISDKTEKKSYKIINLKINNVS